MADNVELTDQPKKFTGPDGNEYSVNMNGVVTDSNGDSLDAKKTSKMIDYIIENDDVELR